jgi:Ca2+-binding EF-hand superfamily protein
MEEGKPLSLEKARTSSMIIKDVVRMEDAVEDKSKKRTVLRDLDCFVLDNSIRESTVGQLRGHTLENKWKIFNEVKKCGIEHVIVAAFSHMTRVDDEFIRQLGERGEDLSTLYAFTEVTESIKNGVPDKDTVPVGMRKMKAFGLRNPIIEVDLADDNVDWMGKFTVEDYCELILNRINWAKGNLTEDQKGINIFINFRDFPFAIAKHPHRLLQVTAFLARLPEDIRPFGLLYEEPTGRLMPEEMGVYTSTVRKVMNDHGWAAGKLLVHVHEKWGLAETVQLSCLSNGADGVWASLCQEGAAVGHACSTITLMNLVRMGNKIVQEKYNCTELRRAAVTVTNATTGNEPHPKQVIYGQRALDMAFDFGGISGGHSGGEFDLAKFFGEKTPVRISTLASSDMIKDRLVELFGIDPQFTIEQAEKMHQVMIQDLTNNRKEEYMSKVGLALLFDRSGGKITEEMRDTIENMKLTSAAAEKLIGEVRVIWDEWDLKDEVQGDECLEFDSFYNGFMSPYFGCFRCEDTKKGLQAIDMDNDGYVDWSEFLVYLKWALHEYPGITNVDELLSTTFQKGLIPAMQDEILKSHEHNQ